MTDKIFSQFSAMQALLDVNKLLDDKAHAQGLTFTTMDPTQRMRSGLSTGIYSFDLITGGGYASSRFSYLYGNTGSGKSTTCYHGMKSALERDIITVVNDHEASMDPTYLSKIGINLDEVCGRRNKKGTWEITPKLRYSLGTTAEATFKFMNQIMKSLPDKIQMWEPKTEENRYFLISPDFDYKPTWVHINKGLKEGKIIEVGDFSPQMMFVTDSLKAMLPDARDEDIDSDPIALLARCFSNSFPLVKSLLGRKNCIYLATNHLTENPLIKFGCLHADTPVPFVDGRHLTMREIVENRIDGEVWSYDEGNKKFVPAKIVDWHFNGTIDKPDDFVTITSDAVETANGIVSFTCTREHKVLTLDGWKQAQDLTTEDHLVTKYPSKINGTLKSFLLGTMVGDCTIKRERCLEFRDKSNPAYLEWKINKLSDHFHFKSHPEYEGLSSNYYTSESRYEFSVWKQKLGRRDPISIIEQMDDLSLAVWFMDDGYGSIKEGKYHGILTIYRLRGDREKLFSLRDAFIRKGLPCSVNVNKGTLCFNKDAFHVLCERICRYIPECMQYKLPAIYKGRYEEFTLSCMSTIETEYVQVVSVTDGSDTKFRSKGKYDISVEGTHNYMVGNIANGVIVHNSKESEPGGKPVQFYPDLKLKMHVNRAQNKIIEEPSVDGGIDRYLEGKATVLKNKSGPCFRSADFRLWLEHNGEPGNGIDPVFDIFTFLSSCGLLEQPTKTTYGIKLKGWESQSFTWKKFKEMILLQEEGKTLRRQIEEMLADGSALEMYYSTLAGGGKTAKIKESVDEEVEVVEI